jgi:hypothetical protein
VRCASAERRVQRSLTPQRLRALIGSLRAASPDASTGAANAQRAGLSDALTQAAHPGGSSLTESQKRKIAENRAAAINKRKARSSEQMKTSVEALDIESMLDNLFVYRVYDCSEQVHGTPHQTRKSRL